MTIILTREHFPGRVKTHLQPGGACYEQEPWCPGPLSPALQRGSTWVWATLLAELCLSLPGSPSLALEGKVWDAGLVLFLQGLNSAFSFQRSKLQHL